MIDKEWDFERNSKNNIFPDKISFGSTTKVYWQHTVIKNQKEFKHVWKASPNSRTNKNSNCPYCANKKVMKGFNDLATEFPKLAKNGTIQKMINFHQSSPVDQM